MFSGAVCLLALLARTAPAASGVFAVKPDWWDGALPKAPPAAQLSDPGSAWSAVQTLNSPWHKPMDGWRVAGPFDGGKGQGMDVAQPPEKQLSAAAMTGKNGAQVAWQEWKPGQPAPLPAEFSDAVVFGYKAVRLDTGARTWLVVEGSGRFKVWVDGQLRIADGRAGDYWSVPCDWLPGTHPVLIKLDVPAGAWSFRAALQPVRPEENEIRCRTEIVRRWPENAGVMEQHGPRIAALYARLGDTINFRHWVVRVLSAQKDPGRLAGIAGAWDDVVARRPEMAASLNTALRDFLAATHDDARLRDAFGDVLLRQVTLDDAEVCVRAFRLAGYLPPAPQAEQFLALCVASNRTATLAYWVETYARRETSPNRIGPVLQPQLAKAGDLARDAIYEGIERVLTAGSSPETCDALAKCYASFALERADSSRVDRLLDLADGAVRKRMPFDAAQWDLEAARIDLDQDRARAALARLVEVKPAYTNAPKYEKLRAEVFKMRAGTARPGAILNDPDDAAQTLARYARQNENSRLLGYIRRTLVERGHYLVADAGDNNLFTSAKAVYRRLFEPYAPSYAPFLAREVADLAARPGMAAEAERLQRRAALVPPAAADAAPAPASLRTVAACATACGSFGGVAELPPGVEETFGEETRANWLGAWQPVLSGAAVDLDGLLVVQNTRAILALVQGAPVWSFVAPLGAGAFNAYGRGYGGLCRPARAGGVVAARLETDQGRFELLGLDARSGTLRWRWRGSSSADEPVGSPAVWRGTHFLVPVLRADTDEYELALVAVDAATGRERFRLPLAATASVSIPLPARGEGLRHARMLAAPAVVGDVAFVDTGLGLVCAVDLQDESVRWSRLYQRKFDDAGGGMRVATTPIVGSRNVLFAPVDSRWLMIVDRNTGALVRRRTDLGWTSVGRCGPEAVAVTTPTSLHLLPLSGVESAQQAIDLPRMLHVAALADGCVLSGAGGLVVVDARGARVRADRTPAGTVPAGLDAEGRWWGWGGTDCRTWGRLDDTAPRKPVRLAAAPVVGAGAETVHTRNGETQEPTAYPAADGAFLVGQNLLTRVGADGGLRWEIPFPAAIVRPAGRRVVVTARRRVWTLDDTDGSVLSVWPPLVGATGDVSVVQASTRGGLVYAAAALPNNSVRIWDLGVEGKESPAALADLPLGPGGVVSLWVSTVATQVWAVAGSADDAEVRVYHAPWSAGVRTEPPPLATLAAQWGGTANAAVWLDRARRNLVIFGRNPPETVRFGLDGMTRHAVEGLTELWAGTCWRWGDLFVFRHTKEQYVRVTEPLSGGSVVLREREDDQADRPLWWWSGQIGTELFGLRRIDADRTMFYRQDLARATESHDGAERVTMSGAPVAAGSQWRGVVQLGDGRIMLLSTLRAEADSPLCGHIWTRGSNTAAMALLPGASLPVQPVTSNLWRVGDAFLTCADWAACADIARLVRAVPATTNFLAFDGVTLDGFLDEWRDEEFVAIPQGRLALRRGGGRGDLFRLALDLTAPAPAAAVAGATDLPAACRIWIGRGPQANFDATPAGAKRLADVMGEALPVRRCAWQVSPDGRHATIEFEFALDRQPWHQPDAAAERAAFGDLALRIRLIDPLAGAVELAGTGRPGPLDFIRLRLPP